VRVDQAVGRLGATHHPVGEVHVEGRDAEQPLGGAFELLEETVRREDGDADVAPLVAAHVRLSLLHPRQVVRVIEARPLPRRITTSLFATTSSLSTP
jgi:hypothetical protein